MSDKDYLNLAINTLNLIREHAYEAYEIGTKDVHSFKLGMILAITNETLREISNDDAPGREK